MTPRRIQRRRTAGWRAPEGAVYVGCGSRWGNPYRVGAVLDLLHGGGPATAEQVTNLYRHQLTTNPIAVAMVRAELAGRDLMCWCPLDTPCHADVLLDVANPEGDPTP